MRALAISAVALALVSAPAWANGQTSALAYCQAQANGIAYVGGAKTGYAAQYNAAVQNCLAGRAGGYGTHGNFRQPRNRAPVVGHCPPGVGPFYRGTLYCVD